jgi:hypothetical protein
MAAPLPAARTGSLEISPRELLFAETYVGSTSREAVTLSNPMETDAQVSFTAPAPFRVARAAVIPASGKIEVSVAFEPSEAGGATAALQIRSGSRTDSIMLRGMGTAVPACPTSTCHVSHFDLAARACVELAAADGTACVTSTCRLPGSCAGARCQTADRKAQTAWAYHAPPGAQITAFGAADDRGNLYWSESRDAGAVLVSMNASGEKRFEVGVTGAGDDGGVSAQAPSGIMVRGGEVILERPGLLALDAWSTATGDLLWEIPQTAVCRFGTSGPFQDDDCTSWSGIAATNSGQIALSGTRSIWGSDMYSYDQLAQWTTPTSAEIGSTVGNFQTQSQLDGLAADPSGRLDYGEWPVGTNGGLLWPPCGDGQYTCLTREDLDGGRTTFPVTEPGRIVGLLGERVAIAGEAGLLVGPNGVARSLDFPMQSVVGDAALAYAIGPAQWPDGGSRPTTITWFAPENPDAHQTIELGGVAADPALSGDGSLLLTCVTPGERPAAYVERFTRSGRIEESFELMRAPVRAIFTTHRLTVLLLDATGKPTLVRAYEIPDEPARAGWITPAANPGNTRQALGGAASAD